MTTSTTPASSTPSTSPAGRTRPRVGGRQPSEQAIDAAIDSATRLLRLPTFRDRYAEIADAAGREQLSRTIARYGRVELLCLDLCRARDYAEGRPSWLSVA